MGGFVIVAVVAAMDAGGTTQIGGGSCGSGGAFSGARNGGFVVTDGAEGSFTQVVVLIGDVSLG